MLLQTYRKEIFRSKCQSTVESLHCFGHLDQDVGEALPYLNAVLGGFEYTRDPPSVTFKAHGKLITVHPRKIAINALRDEQEADKILEWLKGEINEAWERRPEIEPCFEGRPRPRIIEVLKLLPKTNCRECGEATCMVFATRVVEGVKGADDCPPLAPQNQERLRNYMAGFRLD